MICLKPLTWCASYLSYLAPLSLSALAMPISQAWKSLTVMVAVCATQEARQLLAISSSSSNSMLACSVAT